MLSNDSLWIWMGRCGKGPGILSWPRVIKNHKLKSHSEWVFIYPCNHENYVYTVYSFNLLLSNRKLTFLKLDVICISFIFLFHLVNYYLSFVAGTPYAGGVFRVKLALGKDFPQAPPKAFFLTKIFHPNVAKNGEICVNTLKKDWKPDLGIKHILLVSSGYFFFFC